MEKESAIQVPLREELICALCSDLLLQPRVLSCAHAFCLGCLQENLGGPPLENGGTGFDGERAKTGSRWGGGGREVARADGNEEGRRGEKVGNTVDVRCEEIECPSCRGITQLPKEGVQYLPKPAMLEQLLETASEDEKQRTRKELRQRLTKSRTISLQLCVVHDKVQEYFCNQCVEFLCMHCMMESHRSHDYENTTQALSTHVAALRNQLQPAHAFVDKAADMVKQLEQDHDAILTNQKRCRENVKEAFARMRSALEEREKAVLLTIDKYTAGKMNAVTEHRHKLTKGKEKVLCCIESVSQLLGRAGDVSILREDHALLEEIDIQEQLILEVDEDIATAMHSSSYVGFREDHMPAILQEAARVVTLFEFYPESDSGYYASRKIAVEDGREEEEENTYDVLRHGGVNLRYSRSVHHTEKPAVVRRQPNTGVVVKVAQEHNVSESLTPTDSPVASRRSSLSAASSSIFDELSPPTLSNGMSPQMPLRFSSLLSPLPILEPLKVFDKLGRSRKESVHPCGICIMDNDSMMVSDIKNHCLRMIASNGKFIGQIGAEGKGSGLFEEPCGMCMDSKGNIMVAQRQNPRIQRFTSSGKFVSKFGQKSLRGSNLSEPWSVCVASSGEIYVSDWEKSCIHIFHDSGRYVCTLGSKKSGIGVKESLLFPGGITCDSHGRILVTDRGNHCVWLLQPDGSIVTRFGKKGHTPGDLYYPYGIAITQEGKVVVSESGNHRISVFSPSGQFQHCFGRRGGQPGFFDHPRHVAFTSAGELVVVDESNERLQVFSPP